jgi:hypothetical protein
MQIKVGIQRKAVNIIRKIEEMNIDVEFVEQPVSCRDMEGLKICY